MYWNGSEDLHSIHNQVMSTKPVSDDKNEGNWCRISVTSLLPRDKYAISMGYALGRQNKEPGQY